MTGTKYKSPKDERNILGRPTLEEILVMKQKVHTVTVKLTFLGYRKCVWEKLFPPGPG